MAKLLGIDTNAKTVKGQKQGYMTGILYLAPASESGVMNVCPFSTPGCRAGCLNTAGRASFTPSIGTARVRKTQWLKADRKGFVEQLRKDIRELIRKAERKGLIPCVRVNGTSDLPWLALEMAYEFPTVQFYDYTKIPRPWTRTTFNYSLTFSLSETNHADAIDALNNGVNVAVVFDIKRGQPLPTMWYDWPVIDGDEHDLRFLNADAHGVIIGLRAKGRAKQDKHGFVQIAGIQ